MAIPKLIHYCWFGGNPEPELMKKCMESWKRYLPDYKLILWNEESFDVDSNIFVKQAHTLKKWAFVSDYVRFYALYHYGGIYMDTDVEVIKNLDSFLEHEAFTGYENEVFIPTGIVGCTKGHPWAKEIMNYYENKSFVDKSGKTEMTPNTAIITKITTDKFDFNSSKGHQKLRDGLVIYPKEYFCPKSYYDDTIEVTENTYTIHHFEGSWQNGFSRFKLRLHKWFIAIFGKKLHQKIIQWRHSG